MTFPCAAVRLPSWLVAACLAAALLLPLASSAAPPGMQVGLSILVNGAVPRPGHELTVLAAGDRVAVVTVTDDRVDVLVPADDPDTAAREGAREGEALSFRYRGGSSDAGGLAFASGGLVEASATYVLPALVLERADATTGSVPEGEAASVFVTVRNAGATTGLATRVYVTEGGRTLGAAFVGDLARDASRSVTVTFSTAGLAGNRTLVATAAASNGEADPAAATRALLLRVEPDPAPTVTLALSPPAPTDADAIRLSAFAEDDDGVAYVVFQWQADTLRTANVSVAPFQVAIGRLPPNATLRYWATVVDAGPSAKSTTTPEQAVRIRGAEEPAPPETTPTGVEPTVEPTATAPPATEPPTGAPTPTATDADPGGGESSPLAAWLVVAVLGGSVVALALLSRGR